MTLGMLMRAPTAGTLASGIEVTAGATRVQLFPGYGTWKGRNGLGPYTIADRAHADAIVAQTKQAMGPVDLHFDYDHQAVRAPAVAGKAVAAGWFKDLVVDDDGIWAEGVEWTPAAAAALEAREYRYASPYFLHDKSGRVTQLINAALVNYPNFNLAAVADGLPTGDDMNDLEAIAAALGLPAETTRDQAVAAIGSMRTAQTTLTSTASALGLAAGASAAAIASAIGTLKAATPDPTKFVPVAQLDAVTARLATIDGERADAAVASAIQAGKLAPALKDWGLSYFKADEAAFASYIDKAPVILAPGAQPKVSVDAKSDQITADERAIASIFGLTDEQYLASRKELYA